MDRSSGRMNSSATASASPDMLAPMHEFKYSYVKTILNSYLSKPFITGSTKIFSYNTIEVHVRVLGAHHKHGVLYDSRGNQLKSSFTVRYPVMIGILNTVSVRGAVLYNVTGVCNANLMVEALVRAKQIRDTSSISMKAFVGDLEISIISSQCNTTLMLYTVKLENEDQVINNILECMDKSKTIFHCKMCFNPTIQSTHYEKGHGADLKCVHPCAPSLCFDCGVETASVIMMNNASECMICMESTRDGATITRGMVELKCCKGKYVCVDCIAKMNMSCAFCRSNMKFNDYMINIYGEDDDDYEDDDEEYEPYDGEFDDDEETMESGQLHEHPHQGHQHQGHQHQYWHNPNPIEEEHVPIENPQDNEPYYEDRVGDN